jgi:hypothetical protein
LAFGQPAFYLQEIFCVEIRVLMFDQPGITGQGNPVFRFYLESDMYEQDESMNFVKSMT